MLSAAALAIAAIHALPAAAQPAAAGVRSQVWETLADGRVVHRYTLTNKSGAHVSVMDLGAAVTELWVPDKAGKLADVVLGFGKASDYITNNSPQFGLAIGRYANRIVNGRFPLGGTEIKLTTAGRSPHSMHGGPEGFGARLWKGATVRSRDGQAVRFTLVSPDGDQGFPGQLTTHVTYTWTDDNRLIIDYDAVTTKPTVVNLTQHSYFNLGGAGNGDILSHNLQIDADFLMEALPDNTPTGQIVAVKGTPFDFTTPKPIGRDLMAKDPQMVQNRGYNANYVLRRSTIPRQVADAALLSDPASGRTLRIQTTEPGVMLYTANFINTDRVMKGGVKYPLRAGVALETQHHVDSPNQPHFPSTTLLPGDTYRSRTIMAFGAN